MRKDWKGFPLAGLALALALPLVGCGGEWSADAEQSSLSATARGGSKLPPAPASISLDTPDPHLGGTVTFTTSAGALAGWEYPMVAVWCYQQSVLVYMQLAHPTAAFVLGGGSSDWLTAGGAADCSAFLYAYGSQGGKESIRTLASTSFHAGP